MGTKRRRNGEDVSLTDTSFVDANNVPQSPSPIPRPQTPPPVAATPDASIDDITPQANSTKIEPVDDDLLFSDDAEPVLAITTKIEDGAEPVLASTTKIEDEADDVLPPFLAPPSLRPDSRHSMSEDLPLKMRSYSEQQKDLLMSSPTKRQTLIKPVIRVNEPRLVIKKLVLTDFKLYAGVQEIGPFHPSFSAVVGPNGSGKSNVIDSLLFVFGFRATKMRQLKLSELIHNLAADANLRPEYCQVDIHFHSVLDDPDDDTHCEILPDLEIVILRRATQLNQSTYYIDKRTLNYTEVTNFLKTKGVDLDHKRFLILQGEVELIAQMKAKAERDNEDGLLEYLEDIIGTARYKLLIEELLQRVDVLNESCREKELRFELVEKDKSGMEPLKDEALRFLEKEKQLVHNRLLRYQVLIVEHTDKAEAAETKAKELQAKLDQEREDNQELIDLVADVVKEIERLKGQCSDIDPQLSKAIKQQKDLNRQKVAAEERYKNSQSKLKKLEKQRETLEHQLNLNRTKLNQMESDGAKERADLELLNKDLVVEKQKLDAIKSKLRDNTRHLTVQLEDLQRKLAPWNEKLSAKNNEILVVKLTIETIQLQKDEMVATITNAQSRMKEIKVEGQAKEADLAELEHKLDKCREQIGLGKDQVAAAEQRLSGVSEEMSVLQSKHHELRDRVSQHQNRNKVLDLLMRLQRLGRITGFYGRLGDLGRIDPRYDVAISTASGAGLDSLVVDHVEIAQQCIEYLRKNNLGYANFVCLDKLRKFNLGPMHLPSNDVQRLFDLITPNDPKFAPAFYSKMYDTLVAPLLDIAKHVGYGGGRGGKRYKVVTEDGKVVDTLGAMLGGGSHVARGAMKLTTDAIQDDVDPAEVEALDQKIRVKQHEYQEAKRDAEEKKGAMAKLQQLAEDTEFAISRLRLDIDALVQEKSDLKSRLKRMVAEQHKLEEFDQQVDAKIAVLEKLKAERLQLKAQMKDLESEIEDLNQQVMSAGGVELKIQKSKVDSIEQQIEIIMEKTSDARKTQRKLALEITHHQKLLEEAEVLIAKLTEEIEGFVAGQELLAAELKEISDQIRNLETERLKWELELEKIEQDLEEQNERINKFRLMEIEMTNEIETITAKAAKARRHIEHDQNQLDGLQMRDTTPYLEWMKDEAERARYELGSITMLLREELAEVDLAEVEDDIGDLEAYFNDVQCDIEVLIEYGRKMADFDSRLDDMNAAVGERDAVRAECEELKHKRLLEFMEGFNTISMTLKDMYRMITMGGNAELELVDSLDPFSEGILFSVMPPKKLWRNISNLSGGEKTLSSLALVFALHAYKPTPLYVMDEIDAALDFRNVSIVANYIKERTKNAQFVVISLRNNMFELAQQLVGIYKVENKTHSITIRNK